MNANPVCRIAGLSAPRRDRSRWTAQRRPHGRVAASSWPKPRTYDDPRRSCIIPLVFNSEPLLSLRSMTFSFKRFEPSGRISSTSSTSHDQTSKQHHPHCGYHGYRYIEGIVQGKMIAQRSISNNHMVTGIGGNLRLEERWP